MAHSLCHPRTGTQDKLAQSLKLSFPVTQSLTEALTSGTVAKSEDNRGQHTM